MGRAPAGPPQLSGSPEERLPSRALGGPESRQQCQHLNQSNRDLRAMTCLAQRLGFGLSCGEGWSPGNCMIRRRYGSPNLQPLRSLLGFNPIMRCFFSSSARVTRCRAATTDCAQLNHKPQTSSIFTMIYSITKLPAEVPLAK